MRTEKKPFRLLNVTALTGEGLGEVLSEVLERCRWMGSEDLAFYCRVYPEQEPILGGLLEHLKVFVEARDYFRRGGLRAGVLVQTVLGHGERSEWPSPVGFQRVVGLNGKESRSCYCPLDPGFQEFVREGIRMISESDPDWILIDDDYRLDAHWPADKSCFCPLHLEKYAERMGVGRLEISELRERFAEEGPEGVRWRRAWWELESESLWQLLRVMRGAMDEVDPGIPAGICTTASQATLNETSVGILSGGRHRPLLRVGGAVYLDRDAKSLPIRFDSLCRQRNFVLSEVEVLCESDSYPHHRYSLSAQKMLSYLQTGVVLGFSGAKAWVQNTYSFVPGENPRYFHAYELAQSFHGEIADWIGEVRWEGLSCPTSERDLVELPWTATGGKIHRLPGWVEPIGRMSLPWIPGGGAGAITLLDGENTGVFSDEELLGFLRGSVWLEGRAAEIMQERGLGEYLGVHLESDPEFWTSAERFCELPEWNGEASGHRNMTARRDPASIYRMRPEAASTRVLSEYVRWPHWGSPQKGEVVGAAVTLYENSLGGKVMVYAGRFPETLDLQVIHPFRREQLWGVARWMDSDTFRWKLRSDGDLFFLQGRGTNGALVFYLLNLSLDAEPCLLFEGVESVGSEAGWEVLRAGEPWKGITATLTEGGLKLDVTLPAQSGLLLRALPSG